MEEVVARAEVVPERQGFLATLIRAHGKLPLVGRFAMWGLVRACHDARTTSERRMALGTLASTVFAMNGAHSVGAFVAAERTQREIEIFANNPSLINGLACAYGAAMTAALGSTVIAQSAVAVGLVKDMVELRNETDESLPPKGAPRSELVAVGKRFVTDSIATGVMLTPPFLLD